MAQVTINDTALGLEADEDTGKPALVLSHPLGADFRCWEAVLPALRENYRVIRYDVRGHGWSAPGDSLPSIETFGRDVVAILDHLGIERTHFVGVSMGGAIGQWLMVHAPERVDKIVLANTAARLSSPDSWNERIRQTLAEGMAAGADATIDRWVSQDFIEDHPEHVATLREVLEGMSVTGYAGACAALRDMDFRQELRGANHPVLILTGDEDPIVSEDDTAILAAALPQARHVGLKARHMPLIETPEVFAKTIVEFLTSKIASAKARPASGPSRGNARRSPTRTTGAARNSVAKASPRTAARRAAASAPTSKAKPIAKRAQQGKAAARKAAAPVRKAGTATKARSAARSAVPAAPRAAAQRTASAKAAKSPAAKAGASKGSARSQAGKPKAQATAKASTTRASTKKSEAGRATKATTGASSARSLRATPTKATRSVSSAKVSAPKAAPSSKARAGAAKSAKPAATKPKSSAAPKLTQSKKASPKATAASLRNAAAKSGKRAPATRSTSPSRGGTRRGKP